MILVRVAGVALDPTGQHVILLKPVGGSPGEGRLLPIWIGAQEATSILVAIEGADVPRPLAHDLMRSLLDSVGATVTAVAVTRIDEGTFYAEVTLATTLGERVVDARPSDAVALASRVDAPIWVSEEVMQDAGVLDTVTVGDDRDDEVDIVPDEVARERLDEFKRFLDDVDPDDFRG
ncbi:bifunctional nuclease family protein [soil metagenome]